MVKRSLLSISLLFAVSMGASEAISILPVPESTLPDTSAVKNNSDVDVETKKIIDSAFTSSEKPAIKISETPKPEGAAQKVGRFTELSNKLKEFPADLQALLVKGFNNSIGRVCNPACLKDRDALKAALFVGASAATIYACYLLWKKYFAKQEEEKEDEVITRNFCKAAAYSNR